MVTIGLIDMQLNNNQIFEIKQAISVKSPHPGAFAHAKALLAGNDLTGGLVAVDDQILAIRQLILDHSFCSL